MSFATFGRGVKRRRRRERTDLRPGRPFSRGRLEWSARGCADAVAGRSSGSGLPRRLPIPARAQWLRGGDLLVPYSGASASDSHRLPKARPASGRSRWLRSRPRRGKPYRRQRRMQSGATGHFVAARQTLARLVAHVFPDLHLQANGGCAAAPAPPGSGCIEGRGCCSWSFSLWPGAGSHCHGTRWKPAPRRSGKRVGLGDVVLPVAHLTTKQAPLSFRSPYCWDGEQ